MERECNYRWFSTAPKSNSAGTHYCIKDLAHVQDITDDDHECCCGMTDWPE